MCSSPLLLSAFLLKNLIPFIPFWDYVKGAALFCTKTLQLMTSANSSAVPAYVLPLFLALLASTGESLPPVCFCVSALNGYLFGNFPEPDMCVGESVSWHLFGMGNEIDIHSIYFYGNTFVSRGHRTDVVNLFPATFLTTEMIVENPGKWMITCQVSDHLQGKKDKDQRVDAAHTVNGVHSVPAARQILVLHLIQY